APPALPTAPPALPVSPPALPVSSVASMVRDPAALASTGDSVGLWAGLSLALLAAGVVLLALGRCSRG
ncbi:hypothetical protein, partial [Modestobacter altitudinis]|uniref:hypothetical protein n=1 Tax=Modestobacter altitudinis TaxID=2213158 RepID=UPI001C550658